jgi:hypothetical protein
MILHYCRALHDLHTGTVGSKRAGAKWAKATLDPSWAGLIDRAWDGRPNPALSIRQPADAQELSPHWSLSSTLSERHSGLQRLSRRLRRNPYFETTRRIDAHSRMEIL